MAVRLREADSIAAVAELQQHIAELEIQVRRVRLLLTGVLFSILHPSQSALWEPEVEVQCLPQCSPLYLLSQGLSLTGLVLLAGLLQGSLISSCLESLSAWHYRQLPCSGDTYVGAEDI